MSYQYKMVQIPVDPGSGKIYVGGSTAYSSHISGRAVVYI